MQKSVFTVCVSVCVCVCLYPLALEKKQKIKNYDPGFISDLCAGNVRKLVHSWCLNCLNTTFQKMCNTEQYCD